MDFLVLNICMCLVAQLCLTVTPWTVAGQAALFMGFSRQEPWSGLPFPSPNIYVYVCMCVYLYTYVCVYRYMAFPWRPSGEGSACNTGDAGDAGLIPVLGRSLGGGNGSPLQYSCLGNPMDRGAWWATVPGVTRVRHDLATKQPQYVYQNITICFLISGGAADILIKFPRPF